MEAQSLNRKTLEPNKGPRRMELWTVCWGSTLPLRHSDQQRGKIHTLQAPRPGHEDPGESDETPQASGDVNARWRTEISTSVSIKPNHNYALKTVSWAEASKQVDVRQEVLRVWWEQETGGIEYKE